MIKLQGTAKRTAYEYFGTSTNTNESPAEKFRELIRPGSLAE